MARHNLGSIRSQVCKSHKTFRNLENLFGGNKIQSKLEKRDMYVHLCINHKGLAFGSTIVG